MNDRNRQRRARRSPEDLRQDPREPRGYSLRDDPRQTASGTEDDFDWDHADFGEISHAPLSEGLESLLGEESGPLDAVASPRTRRDAGTAPRTVRTVPSTGKKKKRKKKKHGLRSFLLVILILALLCGGAFLLFRQYRPSFADAPLGANGAERPEGVYNILCIGIDKAGKQADVIMLVQFDCMRNQIHVLQVPRDTYINSGSNFSRINAFFLASCNRAFLHEGITEDEEQFRHASGAFADMLSENFGVVIDRFVCVDTARFRDVIDAIGGVDFDVPYAMDYDDPYQNLAIHLQPGMQHLDGAMAEQFVRFRSGYATADIGRMDAQKLFLSAVFRQFRENMTVSRAVELVKTAIGCTITDMSMLDAAYFAEHAMDVSMENVRFATIPGQAVANPTTGASYYVLRRKNAAEAVNAFLNLDPTSAMPQEAFDPSGFFCNSEADYIMEIYRSYLPDESVAVSASDIEQGAISIPLK